MGLVILLENQYMTNKTMKIILIDLDGVLNTYTGNYDENYIPPIKAGALEFLSILSEKYKIKIFTSRNPKSVSEWVEQNNLSSFIDGITNIKEPSYLIIDDRCIKFDGNYSDLNEQIENFRVWYR